MPGPVLAIHAGAGPANKDPALAEQAREALLAALIRGREALEHGGSALDAVVAAVAFMEDEVELFNAGRGSALCTDGSVEMSAAVMTGPHREAGAVAMVRRTRSPVAAARAVMTGSPHVLMAGDGADAYAASCGLEQRDPEYFVTDRQRAGLVDRGSEFAPGTVGAVCRGGDGSLAAATSTGGRRGQLPGRIGDTPVIGAGTWADRSVAVSCTGEGEAFIRAAAARQLADRIGAGVSVEAAGTATLADVGQAGGTGGIIAVTADGAVALPFSSGAMNRGVWRAGAEPQAWV